MIVLKSILFSSAILVLILSANLVAQLEYSTSVLFIAIAVILTTSKEPIDPIKPAPKPFPKPTPIS